MIRSSKKYRVYDARKTNWVYVGKRYYYTNDKDATYLLHKGYYVPCNILRDNKGAFLITTYSKKYAIKK